MKHVKYLTQSLRSRRWSDPIHKEERVRNIAVRRQRENLTGVINATSEKIVNNEEDGNDEATNARVATLLKHLEAYDGQEFDLLKTLVDPINPVQSVENFFDYSYLHKVHFNFFQSRSLSQLSLPFIRRKK